MNRSFPLTSGRFVIAALAATVVSVQVQQRGNLPGTSLNPITPAQERTPAAAAASSAAGTPGQRLEPDQVLGKVKPMARLETRVASRVQSRIRNWIDRGYDPQANATSLYKIATDSTQISVNNSAPR